MGPMSSFRKQYPEEIDLTLYSMSDKPAGLCWADIGMYDLIFLHRPCTEDHLNVMKIAKNENVPVWVDYDDWLYGLPSWNPHIALYSSMPVQTAMSQALACADVISVSTVELYNQFRKINPNVVILPNAYRHDIWKFRQDELPPRENRIVWRGSNTHEADLLSVKDGFQDLPMPVDFIGGVGWLLLGGMKPGSYTIRGGFDASLYFQVLYDLKPKVMIMPLVDCFFNRCKSNIAYIESLMAGAICVAPDMPEWKREGIFNYTPHDAKSFRETVIKACLTPQEEHNEILKSAFKAMRDSYDVSLINQNRMQLVSQLTSPGFEKNPRSPYDQTQGINALSMMRASAQHESKS